MMAGSIANSPKPSKLIVQRIMQSSQLVLDPIGLAAVLDGEPGAMLPGPQRNFQRSRFTAFFHVPMDAAGKLRKRTSKRDTQATAGNGPLDGPLDLLTIRIRR
jgi:hypothetical protein